MQHTLLAVALPTAAAAVANGGLTHRPRRAAAVVARAIHQHHQPKASIPTPPSTSTTATRRGLLMAGVASLVGAQGNLSMSAYAREPPPTPDLSSSSYIQDLMQKSEANKDRCAVAPRIHHHSQSSKVTVLKCITPLPACG